jgi:hypothetical protein
MLDFIAWVVMSGPLIGDFKGGIVSAKYYNDQVNKHCD